MRKEVKYRGTLMKAKGLNFANFSQINICNTQVSNKVKFVASPLLSPFDLSVPSDLILLSQADHYIYGCQLAIYSVYY